MSQHTPGPLKSADCGCLYSGAVQLCPLHAAAPEMITIIKILAFDEGFGGQLARDARALLAKVEGSGKPTTTGSVVSPP